MKITITVENDKLAMHGGFMPAVLVMVSDQGQNPTLRHYVAAGEVASVTYERRQPPDGNPLQINVR